MSSPDRELLSAPQRQSPLAVAFMIVRLIKGIGLVQIGIAIAFVFTTALPGGVLLTAPLVGGLLLGVGILTWWRYTFMVVGDELHVTKGVVSVERLTVPLDRVQSVSVNEEFLHRLVGLVRVEVDTAGSAQAEFTIDAVERPIAEALQRLTAEHVQVGSSSESDLENAQPPAPDHVLIKRTPRELVRIGFSQSPWAGLAVIASFIGFADDIGGFFGLDPPGPGSDTEIGLDILYWIVVAFVVGTVVSMIFQVAREVITHWDLTLTRTSTGLRRTAGLLSKTSKASSLPRVQRFETHQTPITRLLGITTMKLPTIGQGDFHIPGCRSNELETVRNLVIDPDARIEARDRRISPLAVFLAVRNTSIATIVVLAPAWFAVGAWALLIFCVVPLVWLTSRRSNRLYRWGVSAGGLADHTEFFSVTTREVALRKAQSVTVSQRFFEQRRNLATVRFVTAEGTLQIGMLPLSEARDVRDHIIRIVETDRRQWM